MAAALLDRPAPPVRDATRRQFLAGAAAAALFAGCGRTAPVAPPPAGTGWLPVTVPHRHGSTEIPTEPRRVATVGRIEQDAVLALGVVPVVTTEWLGEHPGAIYPWALDALGAAPPPLALPNLDGIQFEKIAAQRPDLILAVYSELSRADYETLAAIAPTVAPPAEYVDLGVPWQELTRIVGRSLGRSERAEGLVAEVEARFATVRAEHPEFVGATALNVYPSGGSYQVYPPPDLGGRLLTDLGFAVPQEILDLADGASYVDLSAERVDLLDTDVLLWLVDDAAHRAQVRADPLYARLDVATQGREVYLDYANDPAAEAASVQTVLSLPFLLDRVVPMLAAAIDGDPATTVPS